MYAKGMTTRDISTHIKEIYGFGISESMVSKITNKILPTIEEWQNCLLYTSDAADDSTEV